MALVPLILLIFAFVCLALAAVGVPQSPRFNLLAAGLAFWVLAVIIEGHPLTH